MSNKPILILPVMAGGVLLASRFVTAFVGDEPSTGLPWESPLQQITEQLTGVMTYMVIIAIFVFGFAYASGLFGFGSDAGEPEQATLAAPRPKPQIGLTADARQAKARVDALSARFRQMPADVIDMAVRIEFDMIHEKHLPALEQAHRDARKTVPACGDEADALDADYAASLGLIAGTLNKLVNDCSARARTDLAVQSRFIETRHSPASDLLSPAGEQES